MSANNRIPDERLTDLLCAETPLAVSIPELRSILTELQSLRSASTPEKAVRVKGLPNPTDVHAWNREAETEAFERLRVDQGLSALEDAPQQEVWPEAPEDWNCTPPRYSRRDGKLSVECVYGDKRQWHLRLSHGNGAAHSLGKFTSAEAALSAALSHPSTPATASEV